MPRTVITLPEARDNISISMWMGGPVPEEWREPDLDMIPEMLADWNVGVVARKQSSAKKGVDHVVGYHIFLEEQGHRFGQR